jgi:hypothetical protein
MVLGITNLARMQDTAGCRMVVFTLGQQEAVVEALRRSWRADAWPRGMRLPARLRPLQAAPRALGGVLRKCTKAAEDARFQATLKRTRGSCFPETLPLTI